MTEEHHDTRLHRYFDGDLDDAEAAELRARLEGAPELRAKLAGLAEVRALVRESVAPALIDLPSDDLWSRIEAQIEPKRSAPAEPVVSSTAAKTVPSTPKIAAAPSPLRAIDGGRVSRPEVQPARGRRVVGIVIAGFALAAAVLLLVIRPGESDPTTDDGAIAAVVPGEGEGTDEPETAEEAVFRTEVLAVDFGENSGAIFAVEGEDGESYSVVWLADVMPKPDAVE